MTKKDYIFEVLDELSSDYETFSDYKEGMANNTTFFVYSQVNKDAIPNIKKNGADGAKEFHETMVYGRGIYTVMSYKDCTGYHWNNAMVKYAVKRGGFDNFLIFDAGLRKRMTMHGALTKEEPISHTIRRLFSQEDFEMLERSYGRNLYRLDEAVDKCHYNYYSNEIQKEFLDKVRAGEPTITLYPGYTYNSEKKLDVSNVDGFAYFGGYGKTAIFRTTDLIVPYAYALKGSGPINGWPASEKEFKYCIEDDESFDNINVSIDAFRRGRKNYPNTRYTEKTVCGFSLVKNGKKFNLLNARTGKYFSPVDFDYCEAFNPATQRATFSINAGKKTIEFMIQSINRGSEVNLYFRSKLDDGTVSEWREISYDMFLKTMDAFKKAKLNESVDEVFTHKDYNTFKSELASNRNEIVYQATDPKTAKLIFDGGPNMEFSGTGLDDTLAYGLGVYTVINKESLFTSKYGRGVVKFVLKDGFKDFLILNSYIRNKYAPGKTVYDQLVELVPSDILQRIDRFLKSGMPGMPSLYNGQIQNHLVRRGIEGYKDTDISRQYGGRGLGKYNTASFARAIKLALQGHNMHDPLAKMIYDELLMAKTKIRGFVFTGGTDGDVALVRDFNALMPIDYSVDGGKTWIGGFDEERFNRINQKVDPFYSYRGQYETTELRAKPINGFSLVSGSKGYNYMDIWYHRPLLPIDVDKAFPFNAQTKSAKFILNGITFDVFSDEDYNIRLFFHFNDQVSEIDYEGFMRVVQKLMTAGKIPNKQIYNNCLLNPANDRKK